MYTASFGSGGGDQPPSNVAQKILAQRATSSNAAPAPAPAAAPQLPPFLRGLNPPDVAPPAGSVDPAYLAYQRQLEYQRQVAGLAAQRQLQNLQGQMVIGPEQLAAQGVIERRGISGNAEARGIFRSGERLVSLADQRTQEAQRLAALRLSTAGRYGDILTTLQQNLAGLSNTAADNAVSNEARALV